MRPVGGVLQWNMYNSEEGSNTLWGTKMKCTVTGVGSMELSLYPLTRVSWRKTLMSDNKDVFLLCGFFGWPGTPAVLQILNRAIMHELCHKIKGKPWCMLIFYRSWHYLCCAGINIVHIHQVFSFLLWHSSCMISLFKVSSLWHWFAARFKSATELNSMMHTTLSNIYRAPNRG
jgi:hypothetical protein